MITTSRGRSLPASVVEMKGTWDCSTNTPFLQNGVGNLGDIYVVSVGGNFNGLDYEATDLIMYDSNNQWTRILGKATKTLSSLQDVLMGVPIETNDLLTFDGAKWTNTSNVNAGRVTISEVAPTANNHATRKDYVDSLISAINTEITALQLTDASTATEILSLDGRVNTNTTNIANHETRIAANETDIVTIFADITTLNNRVSTNETNIFTNSNNITTNTNDITALETRTTANETAITALQLTDASTATEILSLDGRVNTNTTNIANHETRITQAENDIIILDTDITNIINSKGQANGIVPLNNAGQIDSQYYNPSVMELKGSWNATTNTPLLVDGVGNLGDVYLVEVAGTQFTPSIYFDIGDLAVYIDNKWKRIPSKNNTVVQSGNSTIIVNNTNPLQPIITTQQELNTTATPLFNAVNLTSSTLPEHAINKGYVDTAISGVNTNINNLDTRLTTAEGEIDVLQKNGLIPLQYEYSSTVSQPNQISISPASLWASATNLRLGYIPNNLFTGVDLKNYFQSSISVNYPLRVYVSFGASLFYSYKVQSVNTGNATYADLTVQTPLGGAGGFSSPTNGQIINVYFEPSTSPADIIPTAGTGVYTTSTNVQLNINQIDTKLINLDTRTGTVETTKLSDIVSGDAQTLTVSGSGISRTLTNQVNQNNGLLKFNSTGYTAVNGAIPIGNGSSFTTNTITPTTNRITVTNTSGNIQLSTPQDLHTTTNFQSNTQTISGSTNALVLNNASSQFIQSGASSTQSFAGLSSTLSNINALLTLSGLNARLTLTGTNSFAEGGGINMNTIRNSNYQCFRHSSNLRPFQTTFNSFGSMKINGWGATLPNAWDSLQCIIPQYKITPLNHVSNSGNDYYIPYFAVQLDNPSWTANFFIGDILIGFATEECLSTITQWGSSDLTLGLNLVWVNNKLDSNEKAIWGRFAGGTGNNNFYAGGLLTTGTRTGSTDPNEPTNNQDILVAGYDYTTSTFFIQWRDSTNGYNIKATISTPIPEGTLWKNNWNTGSIVPILSILKKNTTQWFYKFLSDRELKSYGITIPNGRPIFY
jgi:predicted  nucleic acid-binding Zn-ribbon protein